MRLDSRQDTRSPGQDTALDSRQHVQPPHLAGENTRRAAAGCRGLDREKPTPTLRCAPRSHPSPGEGCSQFAAAWPPVRTPGHRDQGSVQGNVRPGLSSTTTPSPRPSTTAPLVRLDSRAPWPHPIPSKGSQAHPVAPGRARFAPAQFERCATGDCTDRVQVCTKTRTISPSKVGAGSPRGRGKVRRPHAATTQRQHSRRSPSKNTFCV